MTEEEVVQVNHFEIAKLELQAGDVLVIKPQRPLLPVEALGLEARIKDRVPEGVSLMIFTEPIDLAILSPEAEAIRRCQNCVYWGRGEEQKTVGGRTCGHDNSVGSDNPIFCGSDWSCIDFKWGEMMDCVNFMRKDISDG